ncbi:MAG: ribonuclease P protein component [Flavobacteriales bacterium]|nr:ribonuclease P protein component [Flavobacteriales bacterium]
MQPNQKFPKIEKLKSNKDIDELFAEGKSIHENPIKAIYKLKTDKTKITISATVSVPKKIQKLAVDRNLLKRRMREAYRLNNTPLKQTLRSNNAAINLIFIYNSKQIFDYHTIEDKIKVILSRLNSMFKVGAE